MSSSTLQTSQIMEAKQLSPIIISYGQAILILIDHYQQQKNPDQAKLQRLKYFYGSGLKNYSASKDSQQTEALRKELDTLIDEGRKLGLFAKYEISDHFKVIDEDTSRRTFENTLAVATLPYALKDLALTSLKAQFEYIYKQLSLSKMEVDDSLKLIERLRTLRGDDYNNLLNQHFQPLSKEFIDAICTIDSPERFTILNPEEREKFKYIMLNGLVGYWLFNDKCELNHFFPFQYIYFGGERGRMKKEEMDTLEHPSYQLRMATRQVGLYRSYHSASQESYDQRTKRYIRYSHHNKIKWRSSHPAVEAIPKYPQAPVIHVTYPCAPDMVDSERKDTIVSVIHPSLSGIYRGPFLRVADRFSPDIYRSGPRENFALLVHPFSAGISGSTVVHMAVMKSLHDNNQLLFNNTKTMSSYIKCFMSGLLYSGGAHGFQEMFSVLERGDIRQGFSTITRPQIGVEQTPGDVKDAKPGQALPFHIEKFSDMNFDSLMRIGNEEAFDKALAEAIANNKRMLQKSALHQQVIHQPRMFSQAESGMALKSFNFYKKIMEKNPKITKLLEEYIAKRFEAIERYCQRDVMIQMDCHKNILELVKRPSVNFSHIEREKLKLSRKERESIKMRFLASLFAVDFTEAFSNQAENYQNLVKFLETEPLVVFPLLMLEKFPKNKYKERRAKTR